MKLSLLSNIEFVLILFLYANFSRSNAYHLQTKNKTEFDKLMSLFKDQVFIGANKDKVDNFLKSIRFPNYDAKEYICKPEDCQWKSAKCVSKEDSYYCECLPGYIPVDENKINTKDAVCKAEEYKCETEDCHWNNTICVPREDSYYCECIPGFIPVDESERPTKNALCEAEFECEADTCPYFSTKCVAKGSDFYCDCLEGYKLDVNENKETNKKACIRMNVCENGRDNCDPTTSKCTALGVNDYFCECKDGYKIKSGITTYENKESCINVHVDYICTGHECQFPSSKCVPKGDDYICECEVGYKLKAGKIAERNKEECDDVHVNYICTGYECQFPSSKCVPKGGDYMCECEVGYKLKEGRTKETNKVECDPEEYYCKAEDCQGKNAKCVPNEDSYYCDCLPGYIPADKSNKYTKDAVCIGGCDTVTCEHGGECLLRNKNFECKCTPFYSGKKCETASCGSNPCKNGGKCTIDKEKNEAKCTCQGDYSGDTCEIQICDCGPYSHECERDERGNLICECFEGYAQYKNVCSDCYCGQRSLSCTFDDRGHKECKCLTGYAQRNMSCTEMCRSNSDCLNGGICRYEGNGYFCKCREHFKGDRCEINDVCDLMMETCEAIGAVCSYNELLGKGFCQCPPNREFNRKLEICEDICKPGSCVHGKCEIIDYHKKCRCYEGYEGVECDVKVLKISDKLEWTIMFAMLLAAAACFIIITFCCFMARRQFKTNGKQGHCRNHCRNATMMDAS